MDITLALRIVLKLAKKQALKPEDIGDDGFKRIRMQQQQDAIVIVKQLEKDLNG